ncbi:MAG: M1 family aminopeptidase, partial [Candidatus Acidiferrales bacterium]
HKYIAQFLRRCAGVFALALTLAAGVCAPGASAQSSSKFPLRATQYDVEATIHPTEQTVSARAKVDFVAGAPTRTLIVELHQDLKVTAVRGANGKALEFSRDNNPAINLRVNLPDALVSGNTTSVTFEYAGPLSLEEDSPTKGVRLASVDKTGGYLLLPSRWFPLTNFPSNRYTYHFKITVPDTFAVVGTGKPEAPQLVPAAKAGEQGTATYVFESDRPSPGGTFVFGNLQLNPVKVEGVSVPVYAPPAQAGTANLYGASLTHAVTYFSDVFGSLPDRNYVIAQLPDGSLSEYAGPGIILISARQWSTRPNERLISELVAEQWWNDEILPASSADVWLSDGLSHYSGALYAEETGGEAGLRKALDDFAVGTLMYEDAAPISQAQRLQPYSDEYRSVVEDKGGMVFHMLHNELGDAAFRSLLKDFFAKYAGKTVTLDDFEKMAESRKPATPPVAGQPSLNLVAFFSQWVNSTGIPDFKLEYIVYRTKKGFKVVGKVNQDLDTFRMPIEVRVDTEGNPEYKRINVAGLASQFQIETFGRPKPNGITLDPNNDLLKASPKLRVRAAIARGEGLAASGKFYDAIQEYQHALDLQSNNSLAHFRVGEALFYQKNYQAAANAFRSALDGDLDTAYKWVEVWSHIYIGKIYDLTGQRERAVNEYSRAQHLKDDTGGAQAEADRYLKKPYGEESGGGSTAKS